MGQLATDRLRGSQPRGTPAERGDTPGLGSGFRTPTSSRGSGCRSTDRRWCCSTPMAHSPSFVAPSAETDLEFELVVADQFSTGSDRVTVRVRNQPPPITSIALTPTEPVTTDSPTRITIPRAWPGSGVATALSSQERAAARSQQASPRGVTSSSSVSRRVMATSRSPAKRVWPFRTRLLLPPSRHQPARHGDSP